LREIAKEVDVDTVLTGTLLRAGTQLRLTTQLVEAPSGTLIWSKASHVELREIFQLQDTLVSGVVESLALPLTAGERQQLAHDAPASATAYDLYLRANEAGKEFSRISEAIGLYEQCVAIDPGYAPAWARLGRARWLVGKFSGGAAEKLGEGRSAIERALEINPAFMPAHFLLGLTLTDQARFGWEKDEAATYQAALDCADRALATDPSFGEAYLVIGYVCTFQRRHDEAVAAGEKAITLTPSSSDAYHMAAPDPSAEGAVRAGLPVPAQGEPFLPGPVFAARQCFPCAWAGSATPAAARSCPSKHGRRPVATRSRTASRGSSCLNQIRQRPSGCSSGPSTRLTFAPTCRRMPSSASADADERDISVTTVIREWRKDIRPPWEY
jgi:hypothetical protein